jgi:hypothetical protein
MTETIRFAQNRDSFFALIQAMSMQEQPLLAKPLFDAMSKVENITNVNNLVLTFALSGTEQKTPDAISVSKSALIVLLAHLTFAGYDTFVKALYKPLENLQLDDGETVFISSIVFSELAA